MTRCKWLRAKLWWSQMDRFSPYSREEVKVFTVGSGSSWCKKRSLWRHSKVWWGSVSSFPWLSRVQSFLQRRQDIPNAYSWKNGMILCLGGMSGIPEWPLLPTRQLLAGLGLYCSSPSKRCIWLLVARRVNLGCVYKGSDCCGQSVACLPGWPAKYLRGCERG